MIKPSMSPSISFLVYLSANSVTIPRTYTPPAASRLLKMSGKCNHGYAYKIRAQRRLVAVDCLRLLAYQSRAVNLQNPQVQSPKPDRDERRGSICLKPSTTSYAVFAETTLRVLGMTAPVSRRQKPSRRVLWLANLDS